MNEALIAMGRNSVFMMTTESKNEVNSITTQFIMPCLALCKNNCNVYCFNRQNVIFSFPQVAKAARNPGKLKLKSTIRLIDSIG